jgi:hypothetical protein
MTARVTFGKLDDGTAPDGDTVYDYVYSILREEWPGCKT